MTTIIDRIEDFFLSSFLNPLYDDDDDDDDDPNLPSIETDHRNLYFYNLQHCRSYTSIVLVASFCHRLLVAQKTATTREVYYYYVTHFFHQRECDKAIWDLTNILQLPSRQSLGLTASPKGWFCGSICLYNTETNKLVIDGRQLDNHGAAITPTTYGNSNNIITLAEHT